MRKVFAAAHPASYLSTYTRKEVVRRMHDQRTREVAVR